ncbi:MAG: phosphate acyltransferase [Clostridia bacterium]|nr:phosphate acyltransferase [Clostridiaceae bacterium]HJJ13585.1 phosphate acyltransferase [Clostridiaceae bacterium]
MLHFGSAKSDSTEKVAKAAEHLKKKVPDLICEGELQLDAAIMPEVAKMKSPNGKLKGEANVLIFPDINAGNIAYKLFERFSNVRMYGPACQGLEKPINDLSRACSVERVCDTIAITAVQAQEKDMI